MSAPVSLGPVPEHSTVVPDACNLSESPRRGGRFRCRYRKSGSRRTPPYIDQLSWFDGCTGCQRRKWCPWKMYLTSRERSSCTYRSVNRGLFIVEQSSLEKQSKQGACDHSRSFAVLESEDDGNRKLIKAREFSQGAIPTSLCKIAHPLLEKARVIPLRSAERGPACSPPQPLGGFFSTDSGTYS